MKTCPKCAEQVQDKAKVCKHCGHKFGYQTPKLGCVSAAGLAVLFLYAGSRCSSEQPTKLVDQPAAYNATRITECRDLISNAKAQNVIRSQDGARINVDDKLWAHLPADSKTGILLAVRCADAGRSFGTSDYVSAYGYRSGRRVALATKVGVKFED